MTPRPPPRSIRILMVLWPSFVVAAAANALLFAAIDPNELHLFGYALPHDRLAAYTLGMLICWLFTASASLLTYWLARQPDGE
jgi:hypothetical protein